VLTSQTSDRRHRRIVVRRTWAALILRQHVEGTDGACVYCSANYDVATAWPCMPARTAIYYNGQVHMPQRTTSAEG